MIIPDFIEYKVTRWDTNPYFMGSYSAIPINVDAYVRERIKNYVIRDKIYFIGEYCSTEYQATTTGAHDSGIYCANKLDKKKIPKNKEIAIIGAGISGLACAKQLKHNGFEHITIYEASNRIGGRICTDMEWGIELGASWIHGTNNNSITDLVNNVGNILIHTNYDDIEVRDVMSGTINNEAKNKFMEYCFEINKLAENEEYSDKSESMRKWARNNKYLDNDTISEWIEQVKISQDIGIDASISSCIGQQEGKSYDGGDSFIKGGYHKIPDYLARELDIKLDRPVSKIEIIGNKIEINFKNSEKQYSDIIIMAVPHAILKNNLIEIIDMPAKLKKDINSLETGNLEKVFLKYPVKWWDKCMYGIVGKLNNNVYDNAHDNLYDNNAYDDKEKRWSEFHDVSELTGFPCLFAFSGGSCVKTRPDSDLEVAMEAHAKLTGAFRNL